MNAALVIDIVAGGIIAFFAIRGCIKGFTGEVISLLGLFASIFCGWKFAAPLAEVVLKYVPEWSKSVTELVCSIVIFIAVSLAFAIAGKLVKMIVNAAKLSFIDHMMGLFLGALKSALIMLFLYGAFSIFSPAMPETWGKDSYVLKGAAVVWPPVLKILVDNKLIDLEKLKPAGLEESIAKGILQKQIPGLVSGDQSKEQEETVTSGDKSGSI